LILGLSDDFYAANGRLLAHVYNDEGSAGGPSCATLS
jgi:hypothetical protein